MDDLSATTYHTVEPASRKYSAIWFRAGDEHAMAMLTFR
jgi:hypothetical protein